MYNIYFDISAIILSVMLLIIIYSRRAYSTKSAGLYKLLLGINLLSTCADLVSALSLNGSWPLSLSFNYAINIIYLWAHNMTAVAFLLYVIVLARETYGNLPERIFWIGLSAVDTLLLLTTPLTKWIIYFDDDGSGTYVYHHGPLMIIIYASAIVMLLYALLIFIRHGKTLSAFQKTTITTFLFLVIGAIVFQNLYPEILIESFAVTIALMMMNVALDNPEVFFYKSTYCFNHTAFNTTMTRKLKNKEIFHVIAFTFDDLTVFKNKYGDEKYEDMVSDTIGICHRIMGQKSVYYLSDGRFAIDLGTGDIGTAIDRIGDVVGRSIRISPEKTISIIPHFCVVTNPGFVETVNDLNDAINTMLTDTYHKTGQYVIFCTSNLIEMKRREEQTVHVMHQAIRHDGFDVFYQPIFDWRTGKFISVEALARLKKQTNRYIGPDEFIPIAEKNGIILDVGEIVMEKVCKFIHESNLVELGIEYVEVNLSMIQLTQRSSMERLIDICRRYDVDPSMINFEITETVGRNPSEKNMINSCISYMLDKGFTFSLDDYGSGYATASYIAEMPFKIVKIDKEILWNAMKDKDFDVVLRNSISLINEFGRECVVEGVETEEMAELLSSLGCDFFQGYLYSKPIRDEELVELLKKNKK